MPSEPHPHDHRFGQEVARPGERRTLLVIGLTAVMMVIEIAAGVAYGSMALLADGLHMGSHAAALCIAAFAYRYARRHAGDPRFSFGTGKVNALGGFTGALLLAVFALVMVWESAVRIWSPIAIAFDQALAVAVVGLVVNGISVWILDVRATPEEHGHDHNLRSAYLHVVTDALTSILAIVALLAGKLGGVIWLDPAMGVVGAALVSRWSWGLLRQTSAVLLDHQAAPDVCAAVRRSLEASGQDRVTDLHVWEVGPGIHAAAISIESRTPQSPEAYKRRIPNQLGIHHVTIEVIATPPHGLD